MDHTPLLSVSGLHVSAGEKEILRGVDLTIGCDETHVLMGPNGTGKSTLGHALLGDPAYAITAGTIRFAGEDITKLPVHQRAQRGLFLSFQDPPAIPGVTLSTFLHTALAQKTGERMRLRDFKEKLQQTMALLQMDSSYAERELNVGFSGGEKKESRDIAVAYACAQAGYFRRNRLRAGCRCRSHCF